MKDTVFYKQADIILETIPFLKDFKNFALKGGTALNFFIRDFPRLSVDIDLSYLPILDRKTTLDNINQDLQSLAKRIKEKISGIEIIPRALDQTDSWIGFSLRRDAAQIKIEPNIVFRGSVFEPEKMELSNKAQKYFGKYVEVQSLSLADLYGSKICAALDRQHPRDLFDVRLLLQNEGFTKEIRKAFIVYLIGHNRPISDLLDPNPVEIDEIFKNEFVGMTEMDISVEELIDTRTELFELIRKSLTDSERRFILSVKSGDPDWDLLEIDHVKNLPAIQWKLKNILEMDKGKHNQAFDKLKKTLQM